MQLNKPIRMAAMLHNPGRAAAISLKKIYSHGLSFSLAIFYLFTGPASRAELPPTNEELVVHSIATIVQSFLDTSSFSASDIIIEPTGSEDQLAFDGVRTALIRAGWRISEVEAGGQEPEFKAATSLSALDFYYKRGASRGFFRKPMVKREFAGQILFKLIGEKLDYQGFLDFSGSDEVAPSHVNYVASLKYKQLAPPAPGGGLVKFLEPLAVTATIGGLIYLFFINR